MHQPNVTKGNYNFILFFILVPARLFAFSWTRFDPAQRRNSSPFPMTPSSYDPFFKDAHATAEASLFFS